MPALLIIVGFLLGHGCCAAGACRPKDGQKCLQQHLSSTRKYRQTSVSLISLQGVIVLSASYGAALGECAVHLNPLPRSDLQPRLAPKDEPRSQKPCKSLLSCSPLGCEETFMSSRILPHGLQTLCKGFQSSAPGGSALKEATAALPLRWCFLSEDSTGLEALTHGLQTSHKWFEGAHLRFLPCPRLHPPFPCAGSAGAAPPTARTWPDWERW